MSERDWCDDYDMERPIMDTTIQLTPEKTMFFDGSILDRNGKEIKMADAITDADNNIVVVIGFMSLSGGFMLECRRPQDNNIIECWAHETTLIQH